MHNLAISYQTEKKEIVREDFASVVIEALHNLHNQHYLHNLCSGGCVFDVQTKEVVKVILSFQESSESESEDSDNAEKTSRGLSTKVGIALRQLRFTRKGQMKRGEPVQWRISWDVLQKCIISHGLLSLYKKEGYEGYEDGAEGSAPSEKSALHASTQKTPLSPTDPPYEGYERNAGYEVMRDFEFEDLRENGTPQEREPGVDEE